MEVDRDLDLRTWDVPRLRFLWLRLVLRLRDRDDVPVLLRRRDVLVLVHSRGAHWRGSAFVKKEELGDMMEEGWGLARGLDDEQRRSIATVGESSFVFSLIFFS